MLNVDQDLLFPANEAYHWRSSIECSATNTDCSSSHKTRPTLAVKELGHFRVHVVQNPEAAKFMAELLFLHFRARSHRQHRPEAFHPVQRHSKCNWWRTGV